MQQEKENPSASKKKKQIQCNISFLNAYRYHQHVNSSQSVHEKYLLCQSEELYILNIDIFFSKKTDDSN